MNEVIMAIAMMCQSPKHLSGAKIKQLFPEMTCQIIVSREKDVYVSVSTKKGGYQKRYKCSEFPEKITEIKCP